MKKSVIKKYCQKGIKRNHRGYTEKRGLNLIAGDTETCKGKAFTLQFYNGKKLFFEYVTDKNILDKFIDYIDKNCFVKKLNIIYFHNLEFDLMIIFKRFVEQIYRQGTHSEIKYRGWKIELFTGKVNYVIMRKKKYEGNNIEVKILDSQAFTQLGLDRSLKTFHIDGNKLEAPKWLGEKRIKSKQFEKYAKNDVIVLHKLAQKIIEFHKMFNVTPSVSIAQFSMKVFRHNYIKGNDIIIFPPDEVIELSERSYHGGKNYYLFDEPKYFENCTEIDINSSYPYACMFLPSMVSGQFIKVDNYEPKYCGVYEIDGYIKSKYPIIFTDDFEPIQGEFQNICVTNWDIKAGLEYAEKFDFKIKRGYIYIDTGSYNPFKDFISDMYEKRKHFKEQEDIRTIYKYIMNSFYGKFIQTNEIDKYEYYDTEPKTEIEKQIMENLKCIDIHYYFDKRLGQFVKKQKIWEAGSFYNPFVATLITSIARYNLLKLECKYNSIHSATDSIKTTMKIDDKEISDELGGIKKVVEGKCFIFRNKLYLHYAKDFSNCKHKPEEVKYWDGEQHLCKYALHGYRGSLDTLVKNRYNLLKDKKMKYKYTKVVKLREGFKRGLPIGNFLEFEETMCL